jgi:hypothetical protein
MKNETATQAPWKLRHASEIARKVADLSAALERIDLEIRNFRAQHTVLIGTQTFLRCDTIDGREKLDAEWRELVARRDRTWNKHQAAMQEHAANLTGR